MAHTHPKFNGVLPQTSPSPSTWTTFGRLRVYVFFFNFFLKQAEEQMAEIQYKCEVAEQERARSSFERFQEEKRAALEKAANEAEKRKQEEMRALTENLTQKLRVLTK